MEGGGGLTREQVEGALGSGLIVQEDGLVVTNAHVIKGADAIKVVLGDGREFDATLSLLDEPSDLALLRMDTRGAKMPFATLKSSDDMEVGDLVLAIGNPFGVGQTVTSGIISALSRSSLDISNYNFFIQTDAAINPGNSGGPLVAMDGGVVGINTAIYSRSGGSLGIGFAIPSEMVRAVIAAEKSGGKARIQRPWLGVISQAVSSEMAESLGLSSPSGTLISALHPASPLKKAGAKLGDVIMSMNGKAIRNAEEMKFRMATLPLGEIVDVGLYRDGKERVLKVKTIAPPDEPPREETLLETGLFAGATVVNINPAVIAEHDWLRHDDSGVVITEIRSPSVAARFLQPGDIIQSVNGIAIKTVQELKKAVNARVPGWNVIFSRDGQSQQIMVR
jgi:Do/DeqQ family serine protease